MALREAQRRATDGIGVAEHAVSGFSALQLNTNRAEAEVALGRKKKKRRGHDEEAYDRPGLFERPIVLIGLLAAAICLIAFLVWPAGEKTLLSRAQRLMENEDLSSHNEAQDKYLVQLIERFPNSESAIWAEDQMLLIEMENAEARMQSNVRRRRDPSTEGERKYLEAMDTRKFGDPATALEKFEGIVNLLKSEEKERPFVNLAKRQIREIKSQPIGGTNEVRRFLLEKLDQAEKMLERGDAIGAKQTWEAIVNLYIGNKDFLPIVERAQARLGKSKG